LDLFKKETSGTTGGANHARRESASYEGGGKGVFGSGEVRRGDVINQTHVKRKRGKLSEKK